MLIYEGGLNKYYGRPSMQVFVEKLTDHPFAAIDGHLIDTRWITEDRYRDGCPQRFYDIAFVDAQGFVSALSLRGNSAQAVNRKLLRATGPSGKPWLPHILARFHWVAIANRPPHVEVALSTPSQDDIAQVESFLSGQWAESPWVGI